MDVHQLNWNRYALHIDLYKFYFDIIIKLNIFYFGITGAILSYYLANNVNNTQLEYVLFLPVFFGFCITALSIFGDKLLAESKIDINNLVVKMDFDTLVDTSSLNYLMRISAFFIGITSLVVIWIFFSTVI
jgi:hypothetical protein